MKFKEYILLEELNHNGTATVYHRTRNINNLPSILKQGFLNRGPGYRNLHELGIYTTFSLEDQFDPEMIRNYGPHIIKLHVTELDKYIVYHPDIAKKIHGKDYKLSDQFRKFNLSQNFTQDQLASIDQEQEFTREGKIGKFLFSSPNVRVIDPKDLLTIFYKANKDGKKIRNKIKGAIFLDPHGDFPGSGGNSRNVLCLLKYIPINDGTIKILGYAEAKDASPERMNQLYYDKNAWKTSTDIASFKSIQKIPYDYDYENDGEKIEKYLQINKKSTIDIIKEFKTTRDISSYELKMLLDSNKDKDKIAKIIIKHKKELTNTNIHDLLESAVNKDEIAKLIIEYKKELTNDDVYLLLLYAYNKYEIANILQEDINKLKENNVYSLLDKTTYEKKDEIAKVIIHYKKELTNDDVFNLLHHSNSKDEIAEFLGQKNINKLLPFLHSANDKFLTSKNETINEILTFIIKYKKELTNDDIEDLLYMSPYTSKCRDLMIKYHPDKISEIKNTLNNY